MLLPFDHFQGKGVFDLSSFSSSSSFSDSLLHDQIWQTKEETGTDICYVSLETTSVLDAIRSPSPRTSSSTLSSSHGGATGGPAAHTDVVAAVSGGKDKCVQMVMEDWDRVLSDASGQEQSILGLIMSDVEDPASGFGLMDTGFGLGSVPVTLHQSNPLFSPVSLPEDVIQEQSIESSAENTHTVNQNQAYFYQNQPVLLPLSYGQSQGNHFPAPPASSGQIGIGREFGQTQKVRQLAEPGHDPIHSVLMDQLFTAAELIGAGGDAVFAQGILARLNQQLNRIGEKPPFQRTAFYVCEVLQLILQNTNSAKSSQNLILKIAAYKSFSETSPFLQFTNFTSNQSFIESFEGCDRIHVIDFDFGFGGQWASLMQELVLSNGATRPLKITVFASPTTTHDEVELRFTEENLKRFAREVKIPFEIEILSLELLLNPVYWPPAMRSSKKEAIAANLPVGSVISGYLPLVLRFLKQISPNVVVSQDRSCDRYDAPFPQSVIHSLQYYCSLLESLDAMTTMNPDTVAKIERFWVQPSIEKVITNRHRWKERSPPWRTLFMQCGFLPISFSSLSEAQAECLVQRSSVTGFHAEKTQFSASAASLVLCWQRKELVAVSAWKC